MLCKANLSIVLGGNAIMKWKTLFEEELITIRMDQEDGSLILETNDGGFSPSYVTVRLDRSDAQRLLQALADFDMLAGQAQA
jgi:hypothetical protein